jgi:hypothetical protein
VTERSRSFSLLAVTVCILGTNGCGSSGSAPRTGEASSDASATEIDSGDSSVSSASDALDDLPGVGAEAASDAASACAAFAEAECSQLATCDALDFKVDFYGTQQNCQSRVTQQCLDEIAAPGSRLTAGAMSTCAADTKKQNCSTFLTEPAASCLVAGSLSMGTACEYDSQCLTGLCHTSAVWCGTCQARVPAGETCGLTVAVCQHGLLCADTACPLPSDAGVCSGTAQQVCADPVPQGGACDTTNQCVPGLICASGKCAPAIALGQACTDSRDCIGGAYCTRNPAVCASITYAPSGAACDYAGGTFCAPTYTCRASDGTRSSIGTCSLLAVDGQACQADPDCLWPLRCVTGKCQSPPPATSCH